MATMYPSIIGLGGQFSLFRPYFRGVASTWVAGATSSLVDTTWKIEGTYTGIDTYQIATLKPQFFVANTNTYTPDWILSDYYYVNVPGPPLATLPLNIKFIFKPGTSDIYLSIDSLNFPDWYFLDLPPSPTVWP